MRVGKASATENLIILIYGLQLSTGSRTAVTVCDLGSLLECMLVLYQLIKSCSRDVLIIFFYFSVY